MRDRFACDTSREGTARAAKEPTQGGDDEARRRRVAIAAARIMRASHVTDVGVTRERYGSAGRVHTSAVGEMLPPEYFNKTKDISCDMSYYPCIPT